MEIENKLSTTESHLEDAITKGIRAFKEGGEYCQTILSSCQMAYEKGFKACKRKLSKFLPKLDLSLIIVASPSSSSGSSFNIEEGIKKGGADIAQSCPPITFLFYSSFCSSPSLSFFCYIVARSM